MNPSFADIEKTDIDRTDTDRTDTEKIDTEKIVIDEFAALENFVRPEVRRLAP